MSAWGRHKTVISMTSTADSSQDGTHRPRSFFSLSPRSPRKRRDSSLGLDHPHRSLSPAGRRSSISGSAAGSAAGLLALDHSALSSMSVSSGGTWAMPRPSWLGHGLPGFMHQLKDSILAPDFGPPPEWLPQAMVPLWPTGGVGVHGGGASMHGSTNASMSITSADDSSQIQSSSVVSGVSGAGGGRGRHHYHPKALEEPPFVYGLYNATAFFGDVAMGLVDDVPKRFRPASVRAKGVRPSVCPLKPLYNANSLPLSALKVSVCLFSEMISGVCCCARPAPSCACKLCR